MYKMSENNTLDLSDISSEPGESNIQVEIVDVPEEVEDAEEEVDDAGEEVVDAGEEDEEDGEEDEEDEEDEEEEDETEVPEEVVEAPSTEEVVETVQNILTSDAPVVTKTTEERLDALIELLKSTFHEVEYDDNEYRWTGPLLDIREALNEL
jgi:hypothetical protein